MNSRIIIPQNIIQPRHITLLNPKQNIIRQILHNLGGQHQTPPQKHTINRLLDKIMILWRNDSRTKEPQKEEPSDGGHTRTGEFGADDTGDETASVAEGFRDVGDVADEGVEEALGDEFEVAEVEFGVVVGAELERVDLEAHVGPFLEFFQEGLESQTEVL